MFVDLIDLHHPLCWTVDGLISAAECAALVERIDASPAEVATINMASGPRLDTRTRNNERVIMDDPALASLLFDRVRPHVPDSMRGMTAVGANERLRCYRYRVGQRFRPHHDGAFHRDDREQSLLTFMIYLNEGFAGGETAFLDLDVTIVPRTGLCLIFQHHVLHEARQVTAGVKYAIRSDVMFRRG